MKKTAPGMPVSVLACFCAVLAGCAVLAEKGGRILDGSAFGEKVLETWRTRDFTLKRIRGREGVKLILVPDEWPALKLYLAFEENAGTETIPEAARIYPVSCYFLCSTLSGWNEWNMELSGSGDIAAAGIELTLHLTGVETVDITGGRIRRGDAGITGAGALAALRNRRERIDALAGWMKKSNAGPGGRPVFRGQKEFERYWKPILLPELVSKRKRPESYSAAAAEWVRAEGIRWNKTYSGACFPEDIAALRNGGALLRDWEEALPWIYLSYHWDDITGQITREIRFTK